MLFVVHFLYHKYIIGFQVDVAVMLLFGELFPIAFESQICLPKVV